jgi:hypothetical protein
MGFKTVTGLKEKKAFTILMFLSRDQGSGLGWGDTWGL